MSGYLFFTALFLLLAWLGERRARLMEEDPRLDEVARIAARVRACEMNAAEQQRKETGMESGTERELAALRSGVEALQAKVDAMQRSLDDLRDRPTAAPQLPVIDEPSLIQYLERKGFERVRVVSAAADLNHSATPVEGAPGQLGADAERLPGHGACSWVVEARRRGMIFKGKVIAEAGVVRDLALTPGVHVFP